jgi:hypothetical protein
MTTFGDMRLPASTIPLWAGLQLAGAVGLLLGLLGVSVIGVAAAIGLVLFFVGATLVHLRAHAYRSLPSPLFFLALSIAPLVLT